MLDKSKKSYNFKHSVEFRKNLLYLCIRINSPLFIYTGVCYINYTVLNGFFWFSTLFLSEMSSFDLGNSFFLILNLCQQIPYLMSKLKKPVLTLYTTYKGGER